MLKKFGDSEILPKNLLIKNDGDSKKNSCDTKVCAWKKNCWRNKSEKFRAPVKY